VRSPWPFHRSRADQEEKFFTQLQDAEIGPGVSQIAAYLDGRLFSNPCCREVRAALDLWNVDRLFIGSRNSSPKSCSYRGWLSCCIDLRTSATRAPNRAPENANGSGQALNPPADTVILRIEDEEASAARPGAAPLVRPIEFGQEIIARIALSQKGVGRS